MGVKRRTDEAHKAKSALIDEKAMSLQKGGDHPTCLPCSVKERPIRIDVYLLGNQKLGRYGEIESWHGIFVQVADVRQIEKRIVPGFVNLCRKGHLKQHLNFLCGVSV